MNDRAEQIKKILTESLNPLEIQVVDESHRHAGHAGARPEGETHFRLEIVSGAFAGKSRLERHRMVNALLDLQFRNGLHALSIKALSPEEYTTKG